MTKMDDSRQPGTERVLPHGGDAAARAETASEIRIRVAGALAEIAALLVEVHDLPTLAQRIVDEGRGLFGAVGALLCRLDSPTHTLQPIAVSGDVGPEYGTQLAFSSGSGAPGLAATMSSPLISANVLTDPRIALTPAARLAIEHAPFRAVLAVPLVLGGAVIGTLCILDREGRRFTGEEAQLAQTLAHHAALALENTRLYEVAETARADAVKANRAKDEFLAMLSHELRAPLNSIYGWTRMLRAGQLDKLGAARALEAIERNSLLQTHLMNDLLDVSRIIAGKLELESRDFRLVPAVVNAVDSLQEDADAKGVGLVLTVGTDNCTVLGDPLRVHQVLANLIGNAIKFTPRGGQVTVDVSSSSSIARIVVADTGRGIPSDLLPHVFERFRQGPRVGARDSSGLGLGLSIVRHLVELHGGTVAAESAGEDRGATFIVTLPVTEAPIEAPGHEPERSGGEARLDGVTVLVVEDDKDTRELIGLALREYGAAVTLAASVADAVTAVARSALDVLISDLGLPDGTGYDLIARIRTIERQHRRDPIPAIALTGFSSDVDRRRVLSAGYRTHVVKPIDPFELVEMVASAVGRARPE